MSKTSRTPYKKKNNEKEACERCGKREKKYTISVCNQPTRSTQPCIPLGLLNRVPASAEVGAGMSPLSGGR